ncbi:hypothetical protein [Atlantibacter hermannii]|uniref:hypothetical protein n=1 Tax=Atlantibacter hermannii TaxID=565 RepID=UPI0022B781EC|nr:hypothetical protein [Atlantibacter hermannii]MCZ7836658.1 hypothetical protein [Atlantibacter hermannii]
MQKSVISQGLRYLELQLPAVWSDKADDYTRGISAVFEVLAAHDFGTHRAELGKNIYALAVEQHVIISLRRIQS